TVRALTTALMRGLAKDPAQRYASCAELGDAIAKAIDRGPPLPSLTPLPAALPAPDLIAPDFLHIERTPLSSRVALTEKTARVSSVPVMAETPARNSIQIRQKARRVQNIVAAISLIVIVILVLLGGRRTPPADDAQHDASKPFVSTSAAARNA